MSFPPRLDESIMYRVVKQSATVLSQPPLLGRSLQGKIDGNHPNSYSNNNADATFRRRIAPH